MAEKTKPKIETDYINVRLPVPLAKALRVWKANSGVTIQHFVATIIAAELGVHPFTGKPLPRAKGGKA